MHPSTWLEPLFGSRARVRILRSLAADPRRAWTERELASAVGMSPNTVNLALRQLRDAGVLDFRRLGRTHAVRLRDDSQLTALLQQIFAVETSAWPRMLTALRQAAPSDVVCYLYGSTVKGGTDPRSDLDLVVVAETEEQALSVAGELVDAAWTILPVPIDVIALGRRQVRAKKRAAFLAEVASTGVPLSRARMEAIL